MRRSAIPMRPVHLAAACAALLGACHSDPSPTPPVTPASQAAPPETAAAQIAPIPLSTGAARALGAPVDDVKLAQPHPRIWITADDLPRLRSWATPSNPVYR